MGEELWEIVNECWAQVAVMRPTAEEAAKRIRDVLRSNGKRDSHKDQGRSNGFLWSRYHCLLIVLKVKSK